LLDTGGAIPTDPAAGLPATFDWREKGAVNPIFNQGACGACWAFVVTSALESIVKIVSGKLL
jgi:cathepsin F